MTNEDLIHSVAIYDSDDNLIEILYKSNTIFSLECAIKGYIYLMNSGKFLDTSQYNITLDKTSDPKGSIHYIAKPRLTSGNPTPVPSSQLDCAVCLKASSPTGHWKSCYELCTANSEKFTGGYCEHPGSTNSNECCKCISPTPTDIPDLPKTASIGAGINTYKWYIAKGHTCMPYKWQAGDNCQSVANKFNTTSSYIVVHDKKNPGYSTQCSDGDMGDVTRPSVDDMTVVCANNDPNITNWTDNQPGFPPLDCESVNLPNPHCEGQKGGPYSMGCGTCMMDSGNNPGCNKSGERLISNGNLVFSAYSEQSCYRSWPPFPEPKYDCTKINNTNKCVQMPGGKYSSLSDCIENAPCFIPPPPNDWCVGVGHTCKPYVWKTGDTCESVADKYDTSYNLIVLNTPPSPSSSQDNKSITCQKAMLNRSPLPNPGDRIIVCDNNISISNINVEEQQFCSGVSPAPGQIGWGYYLVDKSYNLCVAGGSPVCELGPSVWPLATSSDT